MAKGGFVTYEQGTRQAEQSKKEKKLTYSDLSPKAKAVIQSASNMRDSKGNLKAGSRLIDAMKEVGVHFDRRFDGEKV